MDLTALVDQVTRQVTAATGAATPSLSPRLVWLVYTEDTRAFSDAVSALTSRGNEVVVAVPRWAEAVLATGNIASQGARIVSEASLKGSLEAEVGAADVVVLPSLPRSLANQLLAKDSDAFAARVVKAALAKGKRVLSFDELSDKLTALGLRQGSLGELTGGSAGVAAENHALARMIDHTLLKADATEAEITKLCQEAAKHHFMSVCVNPSNVALAAKLLKGTDVKVCTVVGFPLGATPSEVKAFETKQAIADGATEIDMVLNIGALKSKRYDLVEADIRAVVQACGGLVSKVILETCLLTDEEKVTACALSKSAGATFVKTSTGFSKGGATAYDIALMRATVGPELGVKASGGVRDRKGALEMIKAGATRIGASASVSIVGGGKSSTSGY